MLSMAGMTSGVDAQGAPTYVPFPNHFGNGQVGGYLNSFDVVGRQAAVIAGRLLAGEQPARLRAELRGPEGAYVVDWREMERWGLSEARLPPGTEVRFRSPTLWQEYRTLIAGTAALLVLQAVLISALLFQRAWRRKAEAESVALAGRLLTAHEDERRHLARELHDDLTQRLARLAIDAGEIVGDARARAAARRRARDRQCARDGNHRDRLGAPAGARRLSRAILRSI
jgi:signal transduction histidine kinase